MTVEERKLNEALGELPDKGQVLGTQVVFSYSFDLADKTLKANIGVSVEKIREFSPDALRSFVKMEIEKDRQRRLR